MKQPATSIQAYDKHTTSGKVERNKRIILQCLLAYGPLTTYEVSLKTETIGFVNYAEAGRRFPELREDGLIEKLTDKGASPSDKENGGFRHRITASGMEEIGGWQQQVLFSSSNNQDQ